MDVLGIFCGIINYDKLCVFVSIQEESTSASEPAVLQQLRREDVEPKSENIESKVKVHLLELIFLISFNLY